MDAEVLSRWQFGITTVYHFFFVPITIGITWLMAGMQTAWLRTKDDQWLRLVKFFARLMLINFAAGVVTGIVQEFQFGMNWSEFSRFVGDIFGAPLALEALVAFFMESTFIGLWIFGWNRLPRGLHLACLYLVALGTTASAAFILSANCWMQNPVGAVYNEATGRAELASFTDVLTNPFFLATLPHQLGAQASGLLSGTAIVTDTIGTGLMLRGPGEPLGAFLAAYAAIEAGRRVSGRTPVDILVTPLTTIVTGGVVGLILGPPISSAMAALGGLVNWGTERQPLLMGVIVAVIMGMVLTLPISSAALGIILDLSGIAAGAATVGCATQMVGFAVASFRENRWSGLLAQGVGTSMLQVPNIVRHPLIWVPPTLASAILGPIATVVLHIESNAVGSGMGTSGLVGQIMTWQVMEPVWGGGRTLAAIVGLHFIAPALLTLGISEFMRRRGWIGPGDMALAKA